MSFKSQHLIRLICVLLFGVQFATGYACAEVPDFVNESIYNSSKAAVSAIDSNLAADLVMLDSGLERGLRRGMVCLVERDSKFIGELIIIESKSNCAAALIINLTENSTIRSGDSVRIKTLQNS